MTTRTITGDMTALNALLFQGELHLAVCHNISSLTDIALQDSARNVVGIVWIDEDDLLWFETDKLQPVIADVVNGNRPHPGVNGRAVAFHFMPGSYAATLTRY